jgi:hypothetical protein
MTRGSTEEGEFDLSGNLCVLQVSEEQRCHSCSRSANWSMIACHEAARPATSLGLDIGVDIGKPQHDRAAILAVDVEAGAEPVADMEKLVEPERRREVVVGRSSRR